MANVQLVQNAPQFQRSTRRPRHTFQVAVRPFSLTPFFIAPVLPGESLKKGLFQARGQSGVIDAAFNNTGFWTEAHFFYVPLRFMDAGFADMVIDPEYDAAALTEAVSAVYYHAGGSINYTRRALEAVRDAFFLDEGEIGPVHPTTGLPVLRLMTDTAFQSLTTLANFDAADLDVDLNADGTITASEVDRARSMWMALVSRGLTDMSYADYLKAYGVKRVADEVIRGPELLRSVRDWKYPGRVIDPGTGAVSSALVVEMQESLDKDRFFKEPGVLLGCFAVRPKTYSSAQSGSVLGFMKTGAQWLPATALNDPAFGSLSFAAGTGPLPGSTSAYQIDIRDLLLYGDQFCADASTGAFTATPSADLARLRYPADTELTGKFGFEVHLDGIMNLTVATHLTGDLTGSTV